MPEWILSVFFVISAFLLLRSVFAQHPYFECPSEWETYAGKCYHFVFYPTKTYNEAQEECQSHGATLLSIDNKEEHAFIMGHLERTDIQRNDWFTSGIRRHSAVLGFVWEGSSTQYKHPTFWLSEKHEKLPGKCLIYHYSGTEYGWSIADVAASLPYICEIPQAESYRILQEERGYDYGMLTFDPNIIPRGPVFSVLPEDTTVLLKTPSVFFDCVADSYPLASYKWKKDGKVIDPVVDDHYTLANGRLTIDNPSEVADAGKYQCSAENRFGTILSTPVQLSFGAIGEFSPVKNAATYAYEYEGTTLVCPHISVAKPDATFQNTRASLSNEMTRTSPVCFTGNIYAINPLHSGASLTRSHKKMFRQLVEQTTIALAYQWYKYPLDFVRPRMKAYAFISGNGKLYFSQVTRVDEGEYYCMTSLVNPGGSKNYLGASQNPGRISTGLFLSVSNQGARNYSPQIQDDFIYIIPSNPLRGQTITLECFAYGTGTLKYSWTRYGLRLPKTAKLRDHNRKLTIKNVQMEDSGIYNCRVYGPDTNSVDDKNYTLVIQAEPFFTFPLKNQFVDIGSQLTWRCIARGGPAPTYRWYKNGELLKNSSSDVTIHNNVLTIHHLNPERNNGMYQCSAKNLYGLTFSSAELRVLSIPPSFAKRPVELETLAALNGNVTILCTPEAAPYPQIDKITWKKDGMPQNLPIESSARVSKLKNGNLFIKGVLKTDEGQYTCLVENDFGSAESTGALTVKDQAVISRPPTNTAVNVNSTAFLYCRASLAPGLDAEYDWFTGTQRIDTEHDPHFSRGTEDEYGGLYIRSAQFGHAGEYACNVRTPIDTTTATAVLIVTGPPGQPGKPFNDRDMYLSDRSIRIIWVDGPDHGSKISFYVVGGKTNFSDSWETVKANVSERDALAEGVPHRGIKATTLENLKPGTAYRFRLRAANMYGIGEASHSSELYAIPGARPEMAPKQIGGGGGKVGVLTITWEPLPIDDQNGYGIGYVVYWRRKPSGNSDKIRWEKRRVHGNVGKYVVLVGIENYYLEYQIQLQPFNIHGDGVKSPVQTIYSAEGMPLGVPQSVYINPYNSTALEVMWIPVPDTRVAMKGKLLGYKVNYWLKEEEEEGDALVAIFYGQMSSALVIGLDPDTWYRVNVQSFSSAGNGPRSEDYEHPTDRSFPMNFPTDVNVHSRSDDSVSVSFRGISTTIDEEALRGYIIRYWRANDDIRLGTDVYLGRNDHGAIEGLNKGVLYKLRIYGYNSGGIGKMSAPATYFTLGGQVSYDPTVTKIEASANEMKSSVLLLLSILLVNSFIPFA